MKIDIGFKFYRKFEWVGDIFQQMFEVVGIRYGNSEGLKSSDWKSKEDILDDLRIYVQVVNYPVKGYRKILGIEWILLKDLKKEIENNLKLLPEYRKVFV